MMRECPRELEVAAVVRAGRWPAACDQELHAHVAGCVECQDVVTITTLLLEADRGADVRVPSAAQVWWRLALRARVERDRAAARPVVWAQGVAAACGVGLTLAAIEHIGPALSGTAVTLAARVSGAVPAVAPAAVVAARVPGLLAGAGLLLVLALASAAAYLWAADE